LIYKVSPTTIWICNTTHTCMCSAYFTLFPLHCCFC